jgi:hypothetical protein
MNRLPRNVIKHFFKKMKKYLEFLFQMGNFTHDDFSLDDLKIFEGRQAHDFDKGRERIITTILVCLNTH